MTLQRDRVFWTISAQIALVNFYLGGFGPAQPLLRADQHTSLTIAGLHGTAMGLASIIAGALNPHLVHKFGRNRAAWLGLGLFALGIVMFVYSPPVQLTLLATLLGGIGTSTVINNMVTGISHHYKEVAGIALPQSNSIGSAGYVAGTLLVGTLAGTSISWRYGLLLAAPLSLILYIVGREKSTEEHIPDADGPQRGKLSPAFWLAWIGFVACISSEFATTFWAAALLRDRVGSTAAISTVCIVALGSGMGIGRWFGGPALKRFKLDRQIQIIIGAQFIGFAIFWFSHILWISLISLLIMGLGISMQFALSSIRLIGLSDNRPDLAIGKSSLAAGLAIGGAPFLLGVLGDSLGISRAYIMVPVLIAIAMVIIATVPSHVDTNRIK
jgi:predicted MFS family arabinose efflux permease